MFTQSQWTASLSLPGQLIKYQDDMHAMHTREWSPIPVLTAQHRTTLTEINMPLLCQASITKIRHFHLNVTLTTCLEWQKTLKHRGACRLWRRHSSWVVTLQRCTALLHSSLNGSKRVLRFTEWSTQPRQYTELCRFPHCPEPQQMIVAINLYTKNCILILKETRLQYFTRW